MEGGAAGRSGWWRRAVPFVRTMALFVAFWALLSVVLGNRLILPSPLAVGTALLDAAGDGELFAHAAVSLARLLGSVALAALVAIPLGILIGASPLWDDLFHLPIELLRPISGIAWIPLALAMFGIGNRLPVFIMFYTAFFPLVIGTAAGVRQVDRRLVAAALTMGLQQRAQLLHVVVPAALPSILVSARLAIAAGWTAVVAAELVGAPSGVGYAIQWYRDMLSTPQVMAFVAVVGVLGFASDAGLRALQRRLVPWAADREARA